MRWFRKRLPTLPTINFTQNIDVDCPICRKKIPIKIDMLQSPDSSERYGATYTGLELPAHRCGSRA